MARRRKNEISNWSILLIIFFFVVVAYYLIKWIIELICIIMVGIAKLVTWISNKNKNNNMKNKKNITKTLLI